MSEKMRNFKKFVAPPGVVADVKMIDTTSTIGYVPTKFLMEPDMLGFEYMPEMPCWAFLVKSSTGRQIVFDLGIRKDWQNLTPNIVDQVNALQLKVKSYKNVAEILRDGGIALGEIESVIWSHHHWDHIGDISTFPGSTELVVGPGFRSAMSPGYPLNQDAPIWESDFEGRNVREVSFDDERGLQIGPFQAVDFFGDGSFYLLNTPGHAIGHVSGLARTTTDPDTFVFMGGDVCHHAGEIRPSELVELPAHLTSEKLPGKMMPACPGAALESLQLQRNRSISQPFFIPTFGFCIPEAIKSIRKTQVMDADSNVLVIYAHDRSVRNVIELFPASMNDWQKRGWSEKMFWRFLEDFETAITKDDTTA